MARVAAFIPDLLFGSRVIEALRAAGHEPLLVSDLDGLEPDAVDVLVVDLTADAPARIALVGASLPDGRPPTLAFYAHVETEVREMAQAAGFELIVPRSRMAREGADLVERLASG